MKKLVNVAIPCGRGALPVSVPKERLLGIVRNRPSRKIAPRRAIAAAVGRLGPAIAALRGADVLLVVSDLTRHAHVKEIVPPLLAALRNAGARVEIIVGTGLHKPHAPAQLAMLLGESTVRRYSVLSHRQVPADLIRYGKTSAGVPRVLNKAIASRDAVITIGVIEPHLYAGYSGGVKTVAVGLAGEASINVTHGVKYLDDPTVRLGSAEGNAFQETLREIVSGVVPRWLAVNVVNDPDGNLVRVFSGTVADVYREGVRFAKGVFETSVRREAGIVICGIGHPKDVNLYQASRAMNYLLDVERPIVRKNGVIIIAAELPDGVGEGISEKRFGAELAAMSSPQDFMRRAKRHGCVAGAHRTYMVARAMAEHAVVFVTKNARALAGLPFPVFGRMDDALAYADTVAGCDAAIYAVPRALCTIATVKER